MELKLNDRLEGVADRPAILDILPVGSIVTTLAGGKYRQIRQGRWVSLAGDVGDSIATWELAKYSSTLTISRIGGNTIRAGALFKLPVGSVVEEVCGVRLVKGGRDSWRCDGGGGLLTSGQVVSVMGDLRIIKLKLWDEEAAVNNPPILTLTEYGVEYWNNTTQRTEVKWGLWVTDPTERISKDHGKMFIAELGVVKVTRVLSREVSNTKVLKDFEEERRTAEAEPKSVELSVTVRVGGVVKDEVVIEALPVGTVLRTGKGNDMVRVEDGWKFALSPGRGVYSSELLLGLRDVLTVVSLG